MRMTRTRLFFTLLAVAFAPAAFATELVSTGNATADAVLQWITSTITLATVLSNFVKSPIDSSGVRLLSLLVNFLAGNWRTLREAWLHDDSDPKPSDGTSGKTLQSLLVFAIGFGAFMLVASHNAQAASVQLTCDAPTTRVSGAPLDPAEIAQYTFYLDGKAIATAPGCTLTYAVPEGVSLTAANVFGVTATDKSTPPLTSAPGTAVSPVASTPKTAPAQPANVKATLR